MIQKEYFSLHGRYHILHLQLWLFLSLIIKKKSFSLSGDTKVQSKGHNHCLIMDEVDGMAGNEDRGGLQELVQLIKKSKIPIITICNDRNSMKMRTLANHCFDLRFQRPRLEQIKVKGIFSH